MKPVLRAFLGVVCVGLVGAASAFPQARVVTAGQDGVSAPKRIKTVNPVYPQEAMAQGIRGIVILEVLIDPQGKVTAAEIIRSIPGLDEAALGAVRQWEYEVTKVGGQPVSVKLTVPITFAMKVPEVTRAAGIPELRQGAAIQYPAGQTEGASVTAEVTLAPDGQVAEAEVTKGSAPFSVALLTALRSWRFAAEGDTVVLSFRVEADFVPPRGDKARVDVRLTGLRRSESAGGPAAAPAPPSGPTADRATEKPAQSPSDSPATTPAAPETAAPTSTPPSTTSTEPAVPPSLPSKPEVAPPAAAPPATTAVPPQTPTTTTPPTTTPPTTIPPPAVPPSVTPPVASAPPPTQPPPTQPPPTQPPPTQPAMTPPTLPQAGPPAPSPARPGAPTEAERKPVPPPPPVEVVSAPRSPEAAPTPVEPGVSAIKDVTLALGVPDLVRGRRPVPPPLARMGGTTGAVEVKFGVDASGATSVKEATGHQVLTAAATYTVQSWFFRRVSAERLHLVALFDFSGETAKASVKPE